MHRQIDAFVVGAAANDENVAFAKGVEGVGEGAEGRFGTSGTGVVTSR